MNVPNRVFLDTNVLNFIVDWSESIFESREVPEGMSAIDHADVTALCAIFMTGRRACWELAVSPASYAEIFATSDPARRKALQRWLDEIRSYWIASQSEEAAATERDLYAADLARRLVPSDLLTALPQAADRQLVAHALAYGCDAFCTRDRRTILNRRPALPMMPLQVLSPAEWWARIRPFAGLWM